MDRWAGKVAVITGASAGIGLATAQAFVRQGLIVVGLARRKDTMQERMKDTKGPGKFYPMKCDIRNEQEVIETFDWIKSNLGTVHILINNAGVVKDKPVEESNAEDFHYIMDINVMGLLYCTKQAMRLMKANGNECHIVNINSIAGHKTPVVEGKHYGVYAASKFAVRSLSEAFVHELQGTKVRVSNISPGLVSTEIFERAEIDTTFLAAAPALSSEDVAESIKHVISAPAHVQITELTIKPLGEKF